MRGIRQLFYAFWVGVCVGFPALTPIESFAAPPRPAIEKVRVQTHSNFTRIVLESNAPLEPNLFTLDGPDRLVVDLPELQWQLPVSSGPVNSKLVKEFSFGLFQPGVSRLILRLSEPTKIIGRVPGRVGRVFLYQIDLIGMSEVGQQQVAEVSGVLPASISDATGELPTAQKVDQATKTAFSTQRFDPDTAEFSILTDAIQEALKSDPPKVQPPVSEGVKTAILTPPVVEEGDATPPAKQAKPKRPARKLRVVLDPGHGGRDPGTGTDFEVQEKTINLAFALELAELMSEDDSYEVYLTREKDVRVALPKRVLFARQKNADLLISIHADWAKDETTQGATAYTLSEKASVKALDSIASDRDSVGRVAGVDLAAEREDVARLLVDLARRETQSRSLKFAELVIEELSKETKVIHRPIRRNNFHVLKAPDMPSVLLELGFMSNPKDREQLATKEWRQKAGKAVKRAIDVWRATTVSRDFANR